LRLQPDVRSQKSLPQERRRTEEKSGATAILLLNSVPEISA
jgi:hypothetical protein